MSRLMPESLVSQVHAWPAAPDNIIRRVLAFSKCFGHFGLGDLSHARLLQLLLQVTRLELLQVAHLVRVRLAQRLL
eukprot:311496-Prymnesium_polylepis.1